MTVAFYRDGNPVSGSEHALFAAWRPYFHDWSLFWNTLHHFPARTRQRPFLQWRASGVDDRGQPERPSLRHGQGMPGQGEGRVSWAAS
jgi:hypothetical protein